ncbi:ABC transporter permease [Candidatus Woesearchaeota archaeon]|nr:ABC transporter permease [Candidatus Woesearchaeota archaeon]
MRVHENETCKKYNVLRQLRAFIVRNSNLTKRYWEWEIVFLIYHTVSALAIGFLATSMDPTGQKFDSLLLFLLIGSVMWVYLSSIFNEVGNQIGYERWEGTIEYTFMAPVKRIVHLLGNSTFAVIYGIARTAIVLAFVIMLFAINISNANILAAFVILIVSAFSFIGLGMIASIAPLMSPERGSQALQIFSALMMLVSGIYYEISILPGWMQAISKISPATYALEGMRKALIEGASISSLGLSHLVPLALMGVIFIPLGMFIFSRAEKIAKKKGQLKRNG